MEGIDGKRLDTYEFKPKTLSVGSFQVDPMRLVAADGVYYTKQGVNALLGFDLLGEHKAIIDLGNSVLWLK